jgi:hypothetical protein
MSIGSDVTDKGLGYVWELSQLCALNLVVNDAAKITGKSLTGLSDLKALRKLTLVLPRGVPVDDVLARVKALEELEELAVAGPLTDVGLKNLEALKKLRILDLTDNTGYTDDALASLMSSLPNLQVVKVVYRPVTSGEKRD